LATARGTRTAIHQSAAWQAYERLRYTILFYALLLTLFMMPLAATIGLPALLIKMLVAVCLLAAVMPNATTRTRWVLLAAMLLLALAPFVPEQADFFHLTYSLRVVGALVGLAATAGTLRFAISTKEVRQETIYAALGTYLLAGIFFGQIYWLIESAHPGSLVGPDPVTEITTVYYSFVTLATLGYGDYLPRTDLTRGLATFEVIGGQLFLAVLVARLIGSFADKEA
jgi:hypothetical protein